MATPAVRVASVDTAILRGADRCASDASGAAARLAAGGGRRGWRPRRAAGDAEAAEDALERAEAGDAGLEQVERDEGGEEIPGRVHPPAQRERQEHERAGKAPDDAVVTHG